jgi:hypothetical protein
MFCNAHNRSPEPNAGKGKISVFQEKLIFVNLHLQITYHIPLPLVNHHLITEVIGGDERGEMGSKKGGHHVQTVSLPFMSAPLGHHSISILTIQ